MPVVNYGDKHPVYVPTTYINIIPSGENANAGTEYEQRNVLTPRFKHTFVAFGGGYFNASVALLILRAVCS